MRRVATLVCALACSVSFTTAAHADFPSTGALRVYSSLPLTGAAKPQSLDVVRAEQLALADHGAKAGGRDIELVSLNDASAKYGAWDPVTVADNARQAATDDRTAVYLGEFNSGATAVSLPILNVQGIAQISPSNTASGLTRTSTERGEPDKYYPSEKRTYARVIPSDYTQARGVLAYARLLGVKTLAVGHDGEVYGATLARMVRSAAKSFGIKTVKLGRVKSGKATATKVKRAHADGFFFGGITQNGAAKIYNAVGAKALLGDDGVDETPFTKDLSNSAAKRMHITNPTLAPSAYSAAAQDFFARFKAKYGKHPEPYAVYGYETMALALDAIDRAGAASQEAIVDALFATRDRDSILGAYSIGPTGDTTLTDFGGYTVAGKRPVFDRTLTAAP